MKNLFEEQENNLKQNYCLNFKKIWEKCNRDFNVLLNKFGE